MREAHPLCWAVTHELVSARRLGPQAGRTRRPNRTAAGESGPRIGPKWTGAVQWGRSSRRIGKRLGGCNSHCSPRRKQLRARSGSDRDPEVRFCGPNWSNAGRLRRYTNLRSGKVTHRDCNRPTSVEGVGEDLGGEDIANVAELTSGLRRSFRNARTSSKSVTQKEVILQTSLT